MVSEKRHKLLSDEAKKKNISIAELVEKKLKGVR
jgi:predicted HicB family RNase H-like nuclease